MNTFSIRKLIALPVLGLALAGAALAADIQTTPVENARLDDFAVGKKAMEAKKWSEAASSFGKVVALVSLFLWSGVGVMGRAIGFI